MSLHEVNPTGFIFLVFSYLQLCIYKLQKSLCQAQLKIRSKHLAWRNKANKPNLTFTTVQIRDQKSGVSGNIPGVSGTIFSGVSGHLLGVSGLPNPEFPGLYPEFRPECPKPGVSGPTPGVSPGVFKTRSFRPYTRSLRAWQHFRPKNWNLNFWQNHPTKFETLLNPSWRMHIEMIDQRKSLRTS